MANECYCMKCDGKKYVKHQYYDVYNVIINNKKYECLEKLLESEKNSYMYYIPFDVIISRGDLTAFGILYKHRKKHIGNTINTIIRGNKINFLEFLQKQKFQWQISHVQTAANANALISLKFICEHGGEYNEEACYNASVGKAWDCVKYLRSLLDKKNEKNN